MKRVPPYAPAVESMPYYGVSLIKFSASTFGWHCHLCGKRSREGFRQTVRRAAQVHRDRHQEAEAKVLIFAKLRQQHERTPQ